MGGETVYQDALVSWYQRPGCLRTLWFRGITGKGGTTNAANENLGPKGVDFPDGFCCWAFWWQQFSYTCHFYLGHPLAEVTAVIQEASWLQLEQGSDR